MLEKQQEYKEKQEENYKNIKAAGKDKYKNLKEKDQTKIELLQELTNAIVEDTEQKKEISLLKKKDQQENLERGRNFHLLYKQKLVERILEK